MNRKLTEAMKDVLESDLEWLTKENAFKWFAVLGIAVTSFWPWIPLALVYESTMQSPWSSVILGYFLLCVVAAVWSFFWLRVFGRWWPF